MQEYIEIKNLKLLRFISRLFPLKHKLAFLIKNYLKEGNNLAVRYYKNWYICTTVTDANHSTLEEIILRADNSQPEVALIRQIKKELPGNMVFIDVGGNIGTFLAQFVNKSEKIFVFEPIPRLNNVIKRSIEYNKGSKITLIAKAVGDKPGIVKMFDNNNSNIVNANASTEGLLDIPVTTLDNEFPDIKKVDFIKIDVEGYELSVLNGARKLIEKHRPSVLVEVHPTYLENYGQHYTEVIHFFEAYNYRIRYYSFLGEARMPRWKRLFSRWAGNKGTRFKDKEDFLKDFNKELRLGVYHFYCEPV